MGKWAMKAPKNRSAESSGPSSRVFSKMIEARETAIGWGSPDLFVVWERVMSKEERRSEMSTEA